MCFGNDISIWQKKYWIITLSVIFFVSAGLRMYHHSDWLVFKSDQARDALIMKKAMTNGIVSLPLLGPEAGSTKFRLGPISYYFQYVSGKIFGSTPESFAYPDLVFGILTIPLLFLLLQKFLSVSVSLWLTALASVSLFLVTFSRFAWNPNSLPFFTTMLAWLFLDALEKEGRARQWRLIAAAICFGIIAQLHLVAIAGLGIGLITFLIFSKTLCFREIIICIVIILALQFPVFMHEYQTNGENTRTFMKAVAGEKYQDEKHAWYEKVFRAYQDGARVTWLIITGQQNTDTILTKGLSINCDKKCRESLPYSIAALAIFSFILSVTYYSWRTTQDTNRKRRLLFIGSWFLGFFLITIMVAYEIETRFYLGIVPPLFIFLGIAIENISNANKSILIKSAVTICGGVLILLNLQTTTKYLHELAISQVSAEESGRDLRFGTEIKVTLGQLRIIADKASQQFAPRTPVIIYGESKHVKSMYYVLSNEYGYRSCYIRGKTKDMLADFNHLFINEYKSSEANTLTPFGTLGAAFEITESPELNTPFPKDCLTY
jgi:4-amino-4-deoxy-L-arabinose transferase-like glycosyltransferase